MTKINRLKFSIDIKATPSKIWKALWDEQCYRQWCSVFYEGSYLKADDWEVGSKVFFLGPDHSGIYSLIEKHIPNKTIQFKHIGKVANKKEQPIDEETKTWSGATEIYTVTEETDHNNLTVELDIMDEHLEYMTATFPKAMEKMKDISENLSH